MMMMMMYIMIIILIVMMMIFDENSPHDYGAYYSVLYHLSI